MKIKAQLELQISKEEARNITLSFLQDLIPYDSEIKQEGQNKYWFSKIYDARGDKVIGFTKEKQVEKRDELILELLKLL